MENTQHEINIYINPQNLVLMPKIGSYYLWSLYIQEDDMIIGKTFIIPWSCFMIYYITIWHVYMPSITYRHMLKKVPH